MKILIIGAEGQLGTELCGEFAGDDLARADLDGAGHHVDVRDCAAVRGLVEKLHPDVVINTAAAHNVAQCEADPALAFNVNALGVWNLAEACRTCRARLVHISTDYVFGRDEQRRPYVETDLPGPVNVYGASKLAGEYLITASGVERIIVRSAALYGTAPCRAKGGRNFVTTMLELAQTKPEVRVVTDEVTTPTFAADLARQIRVLAVKGEPGLYHATCQGACSWYEFAQAIFEERGIKTPLIPAHAEDFPSPVRRPAYSVLENRHAQQQGLDIMPPWREALRAYLAGLPQ